MRLVPGQKTACCGVTEVGRHFSFEAHMMRVLAQY